MVVDIYESLYAKFKFAENGGVVGFILIASKRG